jgi:hypothetical protein
MAEVPEVETLVRDLREAVVGRVLMTTEVLLPAAVRYPDVDEFTALLTDRVFWIRHGGQNTSCCLFQATFYSLSIWRCGGHWHSYRLTIPICPRL